MPIGIGLAAVSTPAAAIVLGPKWIEATPFLMGFAIISTIQYMMGPLTTLLNVNGHTRVQSHTVWIEFFIFSACALAFTPFYHLQGLIYARIISGICNAGIIAYIAHKQLGVTYRGIFHALLRPLSGSILMYFFIRTFIEKLKAQPCN